MKKYNLLFFLALLIAPTTLLSAQADPDAALVEISFSVFPLEPGNWEGIFFAPSGVPEEKITELRFNPHERSIKYQYKGPPPLRFFRKSTDPEGNDTFQTIAVLPLAPEKYPNPVILFFEPKKPQESYALSVMVDSKENFPDESIVFFNTMNITFHGILGKNRITLPPGLSSPISVTPFFSEAAPILLAIEQDNDFLPVLRNKIRFAPERKTIMILRKPQNPNSLRIRTQRLTEFTGNRSTGNETGQ